MTEKDVYLEYTRNNLTFAFEYFKSLRRENKLNKADELYLYEYLRCNDYLNVLQTFSQEIKDFFIWVEKQLISITIVSKLP